MENLIAGILAYLLGAIPAGYIFGLIFRGVDIRRAGSGNVGGINTAKEAGLLPGILTIAFDVGKGALAVYLATLWGTGPAMPALAAFLVILGHNFNLFLGLKGGKGLAAALGAFLVINPLVIAVLILLLIFFSLILRDTNCGAAAAAAAIPLVLYFQYHHAGWVLVGAAMAIIIVIKHIPDFRAYRTGRRKLL